MELFSAALNGRTSEVVRLVGGGAPVNWAHPEHGATLCVVAAQTDHAAAVRALVEGGADVDKAEGVDGGMPCTIAAEYGHVDAAAAGKSFTYNTFAYPHSPY